MTIRIGILGYGNLGKGVEYAIAQNEDMCLTGVYTRRNPAFVKIMTEGVPVYPAHETAAHAAETDVLIMCGGSANDLPIQTPEYAGIFNVVDSFDTHAKIPSHFENVDKAARDGKKVAVISTGWDPGIFSLMRIYSSAVLPAGKTYTFWGKGVSQGHSDAVRRVRGVKDAKQYTIPVQSALDKVRNGESPVFAPRDMHKRECYVVPERGADLGQIEQGIKNMPNYFADYDTSVHFVSEDEMKKNHSGIPHGGFVIREGKTGENNSSSNVMELSLKLDSNPEFTASVLIAYARAAYRMSREGVSGCKTVFDIPPAYLSPIDPGELRKTLL